jgi:hypothetical protein
MRKQTIPPLTHGTGRGFISTEDDALILEALRLGAQSLRETARVLGETMPASAFGKTLLMFAERMDDLHARMT